MRQVKLSRKTVIVVCVVFAVAAVCLMAYAAEYQQDNGLVRGHGGSGGHGSGGHGGSESGGSASATEDSGTFDVGGLAFAYSGTRAVLTKAGTLATDGTGVVVIGEDGAKIVLDRVTHDGTAYTVTGIGSGVFQKASRLGISSVSIAATVTDIVDDAFGSAVFRTADGAPIPLDSVPGYTYVLTRVAGEEGSRPAAVFVQGDAYAPLSEGSGHGGSGGSSERTRS